MLPQHLELKGGASFWSPTASVKWQRGTPKDSLGISELEAEGCELVKPATAIIFPLSIFNDCYIF